MTSKLIFSCSIDGEQHRLEMARCDYKHVHTCMKNGRLCDFPKSVPAYCKLVGHKPDNCVIERVET